MREEELIKKLENVEPPRIEQQDHRRRLRMALLVAHQRRPGVTTWGLAKSKVKRGIDMIGRDLVSRQPVWKIAVTGVLVVALIAGLAIALAFTGQPIRALYDLEGLSPALRESLRRGEPSVEIPSEVEKRILQTLPVGSEAGYMHVTRVNGTYHALVMIEKGLIYVRLAQVILEGDKVEVREFDPIPAHLLLAVETVVGVGRHIEVDIPPGTPVTREVIIRHPDGRQMQTISGPHIDLFLAANVHLKEMGLLEIREIPIRGRIASELTEAERELAIRIARDDPRVQELLAEGAVVTNAIPIFREIISVQHGEVIGEVIEGRASLEMRFGDGKRGSIILVDMEKGVVEEMVELPISIWEEEPPAPITKEEQLKAIDIARGHPLVQEFLAKGAIISLPSYVLTFTYQHGKTIISLPYGQEKIVVPISLPLDRGKRDWNVLVNLAEERVESIEEVCRFRRGVVEERVIYP